MIFPKREFLSRGVSVLVLLLTASAILVSGCQELDTIKRELLKKAESKFIKTKKPFLARDGITIRPCSLYQAANPNSEVVRRLPAETPVRLVDKVGEWYKIRTRDGREGYLSEKMIGGEEIIGLTQQLRRSIEGLPVQAEGVTKNKANFRLAPGRWNTVLEILPAGRKFEMYERVATPRQQHSENPQNAPRRGADPAGHEVAEGPQPAEYPEEDPKKDIWYKVKLEDGRVGYLYTHNLTFTPPEDIARMVPFMRLLAWRTVNTTDDPDLGAKNNYIAAYAPVGKDPGCDFTRLYFMNWSNRLKRRVIGWQMRVSGVLPITDFHYEGRPGFSVRHLHPNRADKLVLANYVFSGGKIRKVSEEEIPNTLTMH